MSGCEVCRDHGITGRDSFAHRLTDGQRLWLCFGHAWAWRLRDSHWYPVPYGSEARSAYDAWVSDRGPIVGQPV